MCPNMDTYWITRNFLLRGKFTSFPTDFGARLILLDMEPIIQQKKPPKSLTRPVEILWEAGKDSHER